MANLRHPQISLDEEHSLRLTEERGEARKAAGARLLAAEPMPVDDWVTLKGELAEASAGRPWRKRD